MFWLYSYFEWLRMILNWENKILYLFLINYSGFKPKYMYFVTVIIF